MMLLLRDFADQMLERMKTRYREEYKENYRIYFTRYQRSIHNLYLSGANLYTFNNRHDDDGATFMLDIEKFAAKLRRQARRDVLSLRKKKKQRAVAELATVDGILNALDIVYGTSVLKCIDKEYRRDSIPESQELEHWINPSP